jgi:hypothetical protein
VIGIIKEILGFRQFSLRGLKNVAGEWCLVCLTFKLKRMHSLYLACPSALLTAPDTWDFRKIHHEIGCLDYFHHLFLAFEPHSLAGVNISILSPTNCLQG